MVIANTGNGNYVAATQICSHENKKQVIFQSGEFFCTDHGARFSTTGEGLNSDGSKGLTIYNTSLDGDLLTIG